MSEMFFDLVHRVEESGKMQEILNTQHAKYQLQPFKIHGINCQTIKKTYISIQEKLQNPNEQSFDPNNWNQNERRVFIWFIIFYTYFKEISSSQITEEEWASFSKTFFNKNPQFLHFQLLTMIKPTCKISWTPEEDECLTKAVQEDENCKWNQVAKSIFYNSNGKIFKSPKHCRERWLNHLDQKKKRGLWTPQQDLKIFRYVMENGKKWCKLVSVLKDTRTEHMIKNRYNSLVNKQRKSKKEREEQLCHRIIKQIKKQIAAAENKKEAFLTQKGEFFITLKSESIENIKQEPKMEDESLEVKVDDQNLNTNEKQEKSEDNGEQESEQELLQPKETSKKEEDNNIYPFLQMNMHPNQPYYQPMAPQYYGYPPYRPNLLPCAYHPVPPYYWM